MSSTRRAAGLGARHFLDHLVDGEVANNQRNWQWFTGTGTDTRPNRVRNPITQAKRYDPAGVFVGRWVPELADPIIDLDEAGQRFRAARGR